MTGCGPPAQVHPCASSGRRWLRRLPVDRVVVGQPHRRALRPARSPAVQARMRAVPLPSGADRERRPTALLSIEAVGRTRRDWNRPTRGSGTRLGHLAGRVLGSAHRARRRPCSVALTREPGPREASSRRSRRSHEGGQQGFAFHPTGPQGARGSGPSVESFWFKRAAEEMAAADPRPEVGGLWIA